MAFCGSIYVKKVMKLLAFIFEQPSYISFFKILSSIDPDQLASDDQCHPQDESIIPVPRQYFCTENVVCFSCLLHILKCTSD